MTVINQTTCTLFTDAERFTQLAAYYEAERRTVWMMLRACLLYTSPSPRDA